MKLIDRLEKNKREKIYDLHPRVVFDALLSPQRKVEKPIDLKKLEIIFSGKLDYSDLIGRKR